MACKSCSRNLSQLSSRQALAFSTAEPQGTAIARQLSRPIASRLQLQQQRQQRHQNRDFGTTPRCQKSWIPDSVKDTVSQLVQSTAQPYQVHHATEVIYKTCARQAAYTISETDRRNGTVTKTEEGEEVGTGSTMWHTDFNLAPTFSTWSQVTMLHMYLVMARLRNLPTREAARSWERQLVDHFSFDAEERMDVVHGITSRGMRHRYLKDIFVQWRGVIVAYDEGVGRGSDAMLASAVWRNVFKGRPDVDARHLAAIVSWMRLSLKSLDQIPDELLFSQAAAVFRWPPKNELAVVDQPARELEKVLSPR